MAYKDVYGDIKKRVGIDDILIFYGGDVPSYRPGWRAMRCPFHEDRTWSASINRDIDRFKCHGCEIGGDVIDVVQSVENLTSRDAVRFIERRLL